MASDHPDSTTQTLYKALNHLALPTTPSPPARLMPFPLAAMASRFLEMQAALTFTCEPLHMLTFPPRIHFTITPFFSLTTSHFGGLDLSNSFSLNLLPP